LRSARRRKAVAHVQAQLGVPERRACRALGRARTTQRLPRRSIPWILAALLLCAGCGGAGVSSEAEPPANTVQGTNDRFEPLRRPLLGFVIEHDAERDAYRVREESGRVLSTGDLEGCEEALVAALKKSYGTGYLNLPIATMGGAQFWGDCFLHHGWRIQENVYTGHYRLLDRRDVRRAWGSYEACRTVLERARVEKGIELASDHMVLLLHGMGRSRDSFSALRDALEEQGYEVGDVAYPSTRRTIREHALQVRRILDSLEGIGTLSIVTHSLGGIVARDLLSLEGEWRARIRVHRMVMIAPPSQGSIAAETMQTWLPYRWLTGGVGQQLTPDEVARIPPPDCEFAIIAGGTGTDDGYNPLLPGDDDGVVTVANTHLDGAAGFLRIDALHTFIAGDERAIEATLRFLESGRL